MDGRSLSGVSSRAINNEMLAGAKCVPQRQFLALKICSVPAALNKRGSSEQATTITIKVMRCALWLIEDAV